MNEQAPNEEPILLQEADLLPEAEAPSLEGAGSELVGEKLEAATGFVDDEMHVLATAAAERIGAHEHDPSAWERAMRKVKARAVATGMALMTLVPIAGMAPKAEAGEGGRRAARIGAEVLWQADQALYEEHMRKMEEARMAGAAAEQAEWSMQQMEQQAETLLRRYEELAAANAQLQGEMDDIAAKGEPSGSDARRLRYLARQQAGFEREQATIKARLTRLDAAMGRAGVRAEQAGRAAEEAERSARKMRRIGAGARVLGSILGEVGHR